MKRLIDRFKKLSIFGKIIVGVAVYFVSVFIGRAIQKVKLSAMQKADDATRGTVAGQYGISADRIPFLDGYANDIEEAIWQWRKDLFTVFFGSWGHRLTTDTATMVDRINKCLTPNEVHYLCDAFYKTYPADLPLTQKKALRLCVTDYCSVDEQQSIRSELFAALR